MLVLSRREGEKLIIGGDIIVTIKQVQGKRVQVGIEAPNDVRIWREGLDLGHDQPEGERATEIPPKSQDCGD